MPLNQNRSLQKEISCYHRNVNMKKSSLSKSSLVLPGDAEDDWCWYWGQLCIMQTKILQVYCVTCDKAVDHLAVICDCPVRCIAVGVTFHLSHRILCSCHDDASRFAYLVAKPSCGYLEQEDFIPLLQVPALSSEVMGRGRNVCLFTVLFSCL